MITIKTPQRILETGTNILNRYSRFYPSLIGRIDEGLFCLKPSRKKMERRIELCREAKQRLCMRVVAEYLQRHNEFMCYPSKENHAALYRAMRYYQDLVYYSDIVEWRSEMQDIDPTVGQFKKLCDSLYQVYQN